MRVDRVAADLCHLTELREVPIVHLISAVRAIGAVNRAIRAACKRAGIERWHIHQLRHSASLTFTRELGLEAARAALGHATVNMSAMYAGHDLEAAKNVAQRVG